MMLGEGREDEEPATGDYDPKDEFLRDAYPHIAQVATE
jgi:hypothetical protein